MTQLFYFFIYKKKKSNSLLFLLFYFHSEIKWRLKITPEVKKEWYFFNQKAKKNNKSIKLNIIYPYEIVGSRGDSQKNIHIWLKNNYTSVLDTKSSPITSTFLSNVRLNSHFPQHSPPQVWVIQFIMFPLKRKLSSSIHSHCRPLLLHSTWHAA
jgi:hypothetical protein